MLDLAKWENIFKEKAKILYSLDDPSHDYLHVNRVVSMALKLAKEENANLEIILPAAYFHDFVTIAKNDPRRSQASKISAIEAIKYLSSIEYPNKFFPEIEHAIEAHSFSANIKAETLEAKIVQDADRLDGIGAIGIARCFSTTALMKKPYYDIDDPWADNRDLNDKYFGIDHFPVKLFKTAEVMQTASAKIEAKKRLNFMKLYIENLKSEI